MKKFNLKNIFAKKIAASSAAMTALLCAAFVFAGCEGLGSDAQSVAPQFFYGGAADGGTAYVTLGKVKANEVGISRTVVPEAAGPVGFSNFELSMFDETAPHPHVTLASAATLEELSSQVIEVAVGERTFTLRATRGGVTFGGSTTATLTKGATTALSFTLTADPSAKGGICVIVNATGQAVYASYILEGPGAARNEPAEFTKTPTGATATVNLSDLDAGVWTLSITFYGDEARTNPLNTYKELVRVSPGLVSRAERSINLNDLYKITYHGLPEGWTVAEWATGASLPMNYSRHSGETINLPDLSAAGLYFAGYYADADFTVTKSEIYVSEARDLDIYPLFTDTIYVSASGDNENNSGWTLNGALQTIEAATGKISNIGLEHQTEGCPYENMNWKILINGALTANSSMYLSPVLDSRAGSVTLRGLGSGGALSMASGTKETVLKITTTTPIVIENLTISGGGGGVGATGASGSGGGISIGEDTLSQLAARVTVGSGVVITNNQAGNYGGGIFACQGSVLTLTGDAVIGDPSKTNPASDCANKAAYGGGIGVKGGKVIFDSDFTGSVCGNYSGSNGGGVYMESAGSVDPSFEMNGGLIKNNKAGGVFADSGDGVYVSGDFSMSGSARVDASNTVPLSGTMTITGPITGAKPVVTIYPGDYSKTTPVLKDNVGGSLVAQYNDKFAVVPDGGTTWYIGDDGKLTNIDPSSLVSLYVKAGGNDALDGRSPETALATLGGAVAKMTDWLNHFNVYIMTDLALDGTPVVFDAPSQSITIKSVDGTQKTIDGQFTAENPGTVLKFKTGSVPVTIENIKIVGGYAYVDGEGKNQGGGIHVTQDANVVLGAGARVEGNKIAGAKGGGVYVEYLANFSMKDDAVVKADASSDVYLNTNGKITIASALTGKTSDTVLYVAQITPPPGGYGYTTDPIIEVAAGSGTSVGAMYSKFAVTPLTDGLGNTTNYRLNSDGKLEVVNSGSGAVGLAIPLTLEAKEAGAVVTFKNWASGPVTYRVNDGTEQTIAQYNVQNLKSTDVEITLENVGDKVSFYGDNATYIYNDVYATNIVCSADCYIYGNIMSLVKSSGFESVTAITEDYAFCKLFIGDETHDNSNKITNKDGCELILPATSLTKYCYMSMFCCTNLTKAPELQAETLAEGCYNSMFANSTELVYACELPATTLAKSCYYSMFNGCHKLVDAPELPATELVESCYSDMFWGCKSLSSITCLATDISATDCTAEWVSGGVPLSGTFTAATGKMDIWSAGGSGIPLGWTKKDASGASGGISETVVTYYVKKDGIGFGLSEDDPFASLEQATWYISSGGNRFTEYDIKIVGELEGLQSFVIDDISKAKSITIEGAQELDASGNPQCAIKGGDGDIDGVLLISVNNDELMGSPLTVTVKNLKIYNGASKPGLVAGHNPGTGYTSTNVILEGVHITGNTGGGIQVLNKSSVTLSDNCKVSSNTATTGSGVYVYSGSTFIMKGSAVVASDNDVYLDENCVVTIGGALTGTAPVATITPKIDAATSSYPTTAVIAVTSDSGTSLAAEHSKFAVTPIYIEGAGITLNYELDAEGKIVAD